MDETRRIVTPAGFTALPAGTVLDRYCIEHVIAAGGFGITYYCHHIGLNRACALKEHFPRQFAYRDGSSSEVRPTDSATFAWALERFIQEGQSLAKCHHANVVSVADVFQMNGTAYMALGYERGQSFKDWLDGLKRVPTQAELDAIVSPLLDALDYVHQQGLLHRDIAPDNIMIREDGTPCLIDFGAARQAVAERSQMMSAIVKTGYSPPEQYMRSGRAQGAWSDIYALSATLYRAVTGATPPEATERQVVDELRPVATVVKDVEVFRPSFLDGIDRGMTLRFAERPQSVAEWRGMLFGDTAPSRRPTIAAPERPAPEPESKPSARAVSFSSLLDARSPVATPWRQTIRTPEFIASAFASLSAPLHILFASVASSLWTGYLACALLVIASGLVRVLWRRTLLTGTELALYWLGSSFATVFGLLAVFQIMEWHLLGARSNESGVLSGALLVLLSGGILVLRHRSLLTGTEFALYWLGSCYAVWMGGIMLFDIWKWRWLSASPNSSGLLLIALVVLASGAVLVFRRHAPLTGAELAIYWLGSSFALMFIMIAVFDFMQWGLPGANPPVSGLITGAMIATMIGIALLARSRRTIASADKPNGSAGSNG